MANKILAVLEQREGKLKKVSFEAIGVAAKLAKELSIDAEALVIGNDIDNLNEIPKYGIKKVVHFKNENLSNYSPSAYSELAVNYAQDIDANYLILPNTGLGKDLAPRIGVRYNAAVVMDCIEINTDNDEVVATRPVYAGKALVDVKFNSEKRILTIRPNVFKSLALETEALPEVDTREVSSPNLTTRVVEFIKSEGKLDVAEADIIVSGGRGLKSAENFHLVEELADAFGAAVGASRAVVDAGWRPHREQVGQTGKTVSPSLYVACGISGAIQHLAGMSSSKFIVAINKDKDAPIFTVADYGIAGDVFEILPPLIEEIKKIKS